MAPPTRGATPTRASARLDPKQPPHAVALHTGHGLLVRSSGDVVAWGGNPHGQVGDGTTTFRPVAVTVPGLTDVEDVQANWVMSVARLQDGRVASWGAGNLGNGSVLTEQTTPVFATGLTTGGRHTLVLLGYGTVLAVGSNLTGQLGNGSVSLPGDPPATTVAAVPGIAGAVAVAAANSMRSGESSFALLNDGTLRAWGLTDRGQLGTGGPTAGSPSPVTVPGLSDIVTVTAGVHASMAIAADGTVYAWGRNDDGRLGLGDTNPRTAPTPVPGLD